MNKNNVKKIVAGTLVSFLLWITLTASGKKFAAYIGDKIVEISKTGIDALTAHEGFSAKPYPDPPGSGKFSIGYGHQIQPNEKFTTVTRAEASDLMRADTAKAAATVRRLITVPLTQERFDALVSFVYNIGSGAFERGTVPRKINAGMTRAAAKTMLEYNKVGGVVHAGLVARRAREASAFT